MQDVFPFLIKINLTQNGNAKEDKTYRKFVQQHPRVTPSLRCSHKSDACRVCGAGADTGLLQAASPGQTQLQMHKAVASPRGSDHTQHVALQYHSLF